MIRSKNLVGPHNLLFCLRNLLVWLLVANYGVLGQEYEASRVLGNNLKTGTSKFDIYDPQIAACEAKDCILKSLSSKSSWDIHNIALDDSNYDSVTFIDQGL